MSSPDVDDWEEMVLTEGKEVRRDFRQTMLSGFALTVPFFVTILVVTWAINFLSDLLAPVVGLLTEIGLVDEMSTLLVEGLSAALILGTVFVVGLMAHHGPDTNLANRVHVLMEDIPGLGSIYTGIERMSDVLLEGDTQSFQEVKLVEFPREGSYAIAFLTARPRSEITEVADCEEMLTVFVPMAPNPVMGGHLLNFPRERVYDVDLTVEEGMEAIMTTGIAIDERAGDESTETVQNVH